MEAEKLKPKEQFRVIRDINNLENSQVPKMPLLIVFPDGTVGEAKTIRAAVALAVGKQYFDAEDGLDEWHSRLEASRRESMKAIQRNIYAAPYDERKGFIEYNYAADPEDPDYEIEAANPPIKIRIENERLFLLSLVKIRSIVILEREDSFMLRPDQQWEEEGPNQCCGRCIYESELDNDQKMLCPVYNGFMKEDEGESCSSFSINKGSIAEYEGGVYINIGEKYNIDELMEKIGQLWTLDREIIE